MEAQNLEKNKTNTVWSFGRVVLLQTIKVSKHRYRSYGYQGYGYQGIATNNQGFETPIEKLWLSFTFIKSKESEILFVLPSFSLGFTPSLT